MTVSFFTHTDWFYAVNPFFSSLNCCFRLQITVHKLAVLLTVFWRKKRAKSVSAKKNGSHTNADHIYLVSAWSCSFTKHELHLRVTAKCCKSFFLALKTRFTPLQSFSCACKFYLRLQSYVHFHKSYHTHANLYDVKFTSYESYFNFCVYCPFKRWELFSFLGELSL